ncbi:glycosyltransferase family 4 protein [Enterobacter cloacae]|uniref:glycosyltransferase family 4 protein n=1 Tax=Enterobacter cloacae TaxID=550 RepID=UPI001E301A74|nr:glycosyltransferase family 4 protein [Enterobacter cloacae]
MNKMKIAIPLLGFGRAGGQRVLSRLASELSHLGHEVIIIAPDDGSIPYYPTDAKLIRTKKHRTKFRFFNLIANYYNIYSSIKNIRPDIAIANHHLTAYIVSFLPRKIKKYYYIQAYEVVFGQNYFTRLVAYISYFMPLKRIVNSKTILPNRLNDFVGVVPAGIDLKIFYPREYEIDSRKNIGIIGRKEKYKGTTDIIELLCDWGKDKDIIVNVSIYLSDENKNLMIDNGIKFNYYEIKNDNQLAEFYRLNDLVIATGLVEDGAFHYPCAEAMACGALVISNYAPLVTTKSSYKLEKFSAESLKEKLNLYFNSSYASIQEEIKSNIAIVNDYSWTNVSQKFESYITEK